MRNGRLLWAVVAWIGVLGCAFPVLAQENRAPAKFRVQDHFTPWERDQILDKPEIAKAQYERMMSLQESGDPHIPTGSALRDAEYPDADSRVDREKLRERTAALYGSRSLDWSAGGTPAANDATDPTTTVATTPTRTAPTTWLQSLALVLMAVTGFALIRWRPRPIE